MKAETPSYLRVVKRALRVLCGCVASLIFGVASEAWGQATGALTLSQAKLGNIFLTTEPVEIPATTTGDTIGWTATNFSGAVTQGTVAAATGSQPTLVHPGNGQPGYFALHLDALSKGTVVASADTTFAVVAPVDVSTMADSPFGVMTHFAQGWDTDIIPLIARAGLHHIRDEQYWDTVEAVKGTYNSTDSYLAYMAAVAAYGLEPLTELTFGNALYDHDPANPSTAWAPCTTDGCTGYANYAQALLAQYGNQIGTVEVWNEYNGGWCAGPAANDRATYYTQMLKAAYQAIKAKQPGTRVLGGAAVLAPQPWFEDLFAAGALNYLDALVIHPYYNVPEDVEKPIQALQSSMAKYGAAGVKPIWATETAFTDTVNAGRQDMARDLVRQLTLMRANGVERIYWYLMRDYNDFVTGLLHSDRDPLGRYVPTSAYPAYANLIQQLYQTQFVQRENTDLRTRFYRFNKNGAELRVLWSTAPPSLLQLHTTQPLTVTDIMGVPQVLQPQNGIVALTGDNNPVYVLGHIDSVQEVGRDLLLADSVDGFSGVQGNTPGTWSYGYYPVTAAPYQPDQVQPMTWTRTSYDYSWQCPCPYAMVSNTVAGPSSAGNTPVWTVRRWQSSSAGKARITGSATHVSPGGDGTGVKILVDGNEVFSSLIGAPGGATSVSFDLNVTLKINSLVDFVVTPGPGTDINFDAVDYRAQITAPTPLAITSFTDWQQYYFTAEQLADPTISGDTADPLQDGMCNLLKYAFGLDPMANGVEYQPQVNVQTVDGLSYLTLSYRCLSASTDLQYVVEAADALTGDSWTASGTPVNPPVENDDGTVTITCRDDFPITTKPQRFLRLQITKSEAATTSSQVAILTTRKVQSKVGAY